MKTTQNKTNIIKTKQSNKNKQQQKKSTKNQNLSTITENKNIKIHGITQRTTPHKQVLNLFSRENISVNFFLYFVSPHHFTFQETKYKHPKTKSKHINKSKKYANSNQNKKTFKNACKKTVELTLRCAFAPLFTCSHVVSQRSRRTNKPHNHGIGAQFGIHERSRL